MTRFKSLQALENEICAFNPDFDETADLIAAVLSSVRERFPNDCHDLDYHAEKLTKTLEAMDDNIFPYEPDPMTLAKERSMEEESA